MVLPEDQPWELQKQGPVPPYDTLQSSGQGGEIPVGHPTGIIPLLPLQVAPPPGNSTQNHPSHLWVQGYVH